MEEFYKPDKRWELYNIESKEQYVEQLIVKGCFHDQVPKDVVDAYVTVEYLMAHAWYYWPMYDEAFNKLLLIIEMAVKLKADQKGIKKSIQQENGKVWIRSIGKITNDICNVVHLKDLKKLLNRAQDLRNTKMHPNQNSFGGPSGAVRNIQYSVNVINRLFKHDEWHQQRYETLSEIKKTLSHLNKHLLVVTNGSKGHVIHSCPDFDLIDNTLLIACTPLIDVTKLEEDANYLPDSIIYRFQDFTISKESISGISGDGKPIKLTVTEHPKSIRANKLYLQYLEGLMKKEPFMHFGFISQDAGWKLVEEEYQYYLD